MRDTVSRFLVRALLVLVPTISVAGVITHDFSLNTGPLVGHAAGPFSIEFQLNDGIGVGDGNNTAVLSNFMFGGGSAIGAPIIVGGANGSASSSVSLTDNAFFNQFLQQFTPGNQLSFRLELTTNVDNGGVPDQFTFAILDSTGVEIPTVASFFDVFVQIDIDSPNPVVHTFGTDISRSPAAGGPPLSIEAPTARPVVSEVPEPASVALLASGLGFIGLMRRALCVRRS